MKVGRRLKRLALLLADELAHRHKWGFSYRPSDWNASDERIEKLNAKIAKRGGNHEAVGRHGVDWEALAGTGEGDRE